MCASIRASASPASGRLSVVVLAACETWIVADCVAADDVEGDPLTAETRRGRDHDARADSLSG